MARLASLAVMLQTGRAVAYAEGNADIIAPSVMMTALHWDPSGDVQNCAVLERGVSHTALVHLQLPTDSMELQASEVCVLYTVRSDTAQNWWFVSPPPAEPTARVCSLTQSNPVVFRLPLELQVGYARLTVLLEQPRESTTRLVGPLSAVLVVVDAPDRPAWMQRPRPLTLSAESQRSLAKSYQIVREDERAEREAYVRRTSDGRAGYTPLHAWDQLRRPTLDAVRALLSTEALAALEAPTPASLWALVGVPAPGQPVYSLRLLSVEGAARLAAELNHSHRDEAVKKAPTNNDERAGDAGDEQDAEDADEAALPSMLLDEISLQALAHSIASAVLTPLARLLFPTWSAGGSLDSYHAFSIHRRAAAADQDSWFRPSSNSEPSAVRSAWLVRDAQSNASNASRTMMSGRFGVHSDICEVSLNVALRASDDLAGSRVGFEPGFDAREPVTKEQGKGGQTHSSNQAAVGDVLWLDHRPGFAFFNLCQHRHGVEPLRRGGRDTIVVRAFASAFRRSPAESWYEQCAALSDTHADEKVEL